MSIPYDTENSYAEFGNAFFRGKLNGATGVARFKLTAQALYAVDTINIGPHQITYSFFFRYASAGPGTYISALIDVPDNDVHVEFVAYGAGAIAFYVDGVARPNYARKGCHRSLLPHIEVIPLSPGQHTVALAGPGASSDGYIFCRYIRRTGGDNI